MSCYLPACIGCIESKYCSLGWGPCHPKPQAMSNGVELPVSSVCLRFRQNFTFRTKFPGATLVGFVSWLLYPSLPHPPPALNRGSGSLWRASEECQAWHNLVTKSSLGHLHCVLKVGLALPRGNLVPFSRVAGGEPLQPLSLSPTGPKPGGCWGCPTSAFTVSPAPSSLFLPPPCPSCTL